MKVTGGCYCGGVRYEVDGDPSFKAQCHCRECQYITGGGPNFFMVMPASGFKLSQGQTKSFTRSDLAAPVTREFCPNCGTHILTRAPGLKDGIVLKVGSMDEPKQYGTPQIAIFTMDKQTYHTIADGLPSFERMPGSA